MAQNLQRLPFHIQDDFVETAFEKRFQGILRLAWQQRSWHVIAAVPGSGKSLGIHDFVLYGNPAKPLNASLSLPIVAIRAPKNNTREMSLLVSLSHIFGVVPRMPSYMLRVWLVDMFAKAHVECLIIDDAQDLPLMHLAYLKELTDNLVAPPYRQKIGLCLVVAQSGNVIPLKDTLSRNEVLWRQFHRRMDTQRPFCIVLGHTKDEVGDILLAFEEAYHPQLPDLQLTRWTESIYTWLTHPNLDPDTSGRVSMDLLTKFVTTVLLQTYEQRKTDVDQHILEAAATLLILHRDENVAIDKEMLANVSVTEIP